MGRKRCENNVNGTIDMNEMQYLVSKLNVASSGNQNSSNNQNQKVLEVSDVPLKYLNTLGFINYNHYGDVPWPEGEVYLSSDYTSVTNLLGIDCEMVGVGPYAKSALGRVSIVNQFGYCIYDTFVTPFEEVTDYRTPFSGIRSEDLIYAPMVHAVLKEVADLVRGRILVGHSIHNDLEVLNLYGHPLIRDTALYFKQLSNSTKSPSLKKLTKQYLKIEIQTGEHSSIIDAQATLNLYLMHSEQWEKSLTEKLELANIPATVASKLSLISEMHVAPRETDLEVESKEVFLRENRILGAYSTAEEYLDVQFRLLLEDFLRPLRAGVKTVKKIRGPNNTHTSSKVETLFHNVKIGGARKGEKIEAKGESQLLIPVERNNLKDVDWEETKMFLNGSLVLLTPDNFKSVKFAVVTYRASEQRTDSYYVSVIVQFSKDGPSWLVDENSRFLMMESRAFYEAYKHTLEYLQVVKFNDFPMKKYIVDVVTQSSPPAYLKAKKNDFLDFSVLMNETESYSSRSHLARPLETHNWPSAVELNLDTSQYEAFQKALTQELTIIQGPPGTGKTFIGIQIVKLLLSNPFMLSSPILIVSYTNHALDQTLEHILKFITVNMCKGDDKKAQQLVLRIGGGSKSEIIQPLTLKHKQEKFTELKKLRAKILSLEKAIQAVGGLNLEQIFLQQAFLNFNKLPAVIKSRLSTDEESKPIYDQWKKFHGEINNNPQRWFQLENQNQQKQISNSNSKIPPKAKPLVLLEHSDMKNILCQNPSVTLQDLNLYLSTRLLNGTITEDQLIIRWTYYVYLVKKVNSFVKSFKSQIKTAKLECKEMDHCLSQNGCIKAAKVIGMTTTGAVKYKKMVVKSMKPKIMIVEEAAHVLEAHVVASLTQHCEQMIMIGDHKQLRPLTADNNLAVEYNLDVSLMERLVNNGKQQGKQNWVQLKVQHRMRPEVAKMVCPVIYEELYNHPDVSKYPNVGGCAKNIFFVDHQYSEAREQGSCSSYNEYEARYLVGLVQYFVNGGYYQSTQITIIAAYLAQKLLIDNELKNKMLSSAVRVSTVDGFQGEENDIILLSLVRSNAENIVGFLKTDNRVCVALSRARHGLFMIGNMSCLKDCSETWMQINGILTEMNCISDKLPLTGSGFQLPSSIDLSILQVPTENSKNPRPIPQPRKKRNKKAKAALSTMSTSSVFPSTSSLPLKLPISPIKSSPLSSTTSSMSQSQESITYRMRFKTGNIPSTEITSPSLQSNSFPAALITSTAVKPLPTALPKLKSNVRLPCGHHQQLSERQMQNISAVKCIYGVTKTLPCGHVIKLQCSQNIHEFKCPKNASVKLPCGHSRSGECHAVVGKRATKYVCKLPIKQKLKCGHRQSAICGQPLKSTVCSGSLTKTLKCGHAQDVPCSKKESDIKCQSCSKNAPQNMIITLPCLHKITIPNSGSGIDASTFICKELVKKELPCGHKTMEKHLCSQVLSKAYVCNIMCESILPCGHEYVTKCSQMQSKVTCAILVKRKLPCGHEQRLPCNKSPEIYKCIRFISKDLKCGHKQEILCCKRESDILCQSCLINAPQNMIINLPCGHKITIPNTGGGINAATFICKEMVNKALPCGHKTMEKYLCSQVISSSYVCTQIISAARKCGHQQEENVRCYQKSSLPKCSAKIVKKLSCGHEVETSCGKKETEILCNEFVEFTVFGCDHVQKNICHQKKSLKKCGFTLTKRLPCGHDNQVACHMDPSNVKCKDKLVSECSHQKQLLCGETCKACIKDLAAAIKQLKITAPKALVLNETTQISQPVSKPLTSQIQIPCTKIFNCGHKCCIPNCTKSKKKIHNQYQCLDKCKRKCPKGHPCPGDHQCYTHCKVYVGKGCKSIVTLNRKLDSSSIGWGLPDTKTVECCTADSIMGYARAA